MLLCTTKASLAELIKLVIMYIYFYWISIEIIPNCDCEMQLFIDYCYVIRNIPERYFLLGYTNLF